MNEDQFIRENLNLVRYVIKKYYPNHYWDEDVFQWGCMGLLSATRTYIAEKGKFATYADCCIRTSISMKVFRTQKAQKRQCAEVVSLSKVIWGEGGRAIVLEDVIPSPACFEEDIALRDALGKAMLLLSDKEAKVVYLIGRGLWQKEIAEILGVKQRQVSRLRAKAIAKIRRVMAM